MWLYNKDYKKHVLSFSSVTVICAISQSWTTLIHFVKIITSIYLKSTGMYITSKESLIFWIEYYFYIYLFGLISIPNASNVINYAIIISQELSMYINQIIVC